MNLLLDTCVIIWLVNHDSQLSLKARKTIDEALAVHVSPISAWELGLKIAKAKFKLQESLETWWPQVIKVHQLSEFPLHGLEAIRATCLPSIHADPADRLLTAVAIENQFTFLTPDPVIHQYPGLKTLW